MLTSPLCRFIPRGLALGLALGLGLGALAPTPALAAPIAINDIDKLSAHSTRDAAGVYWLQPGEYVSTSLWVEAAGLGVGSGVEYAATGSASAQADGYAYGYGIVLGGNFLQSGGSIAATGTGADGYGIRFVKLEDKTIGNFTQFGGSLTARGENGGIGVYLGSGIFSQAGNGALLAQGEAGRGIWLDRGNFAQSGGSLTAQGKNNGAGIYLDSGHFNQHGGSALAQGTGGLTGGHGIKLALGNFTQSGGTLTAEGRGANGYGIYLANGKFIKLSGALTATGADNGAGIYLSSGALSMSGGTLTAQGKNNGKGLWLDDGALSMFGGTLTAQGDDSGVGLQLNSGALTLYGGTLAAQGNTNGVGLVSTKFIQSGGFLELLPGDGIGTSVRIDPFGDSVAAFKAGAALVPVIDFTVKRTGLFEVSSLTIVTIDPKARLAPRGVTTLALEKTPPPRK